MASTHVTVAPSLEQRFKGWAAERRLHQVILCHPVAQQQSIGGRVSNKVPWPQDWEGGG